jgi:glutaredoxin
MRQVVLYSRPGCHLCDAAREVVLAVRQRHPFAFEEVDIEGSDDLVRDYGIRVPVVAVDGEEVFEIEVEASRLAALVRL